MGCTSSKAMQYPGNRIQGQQPYRPNASEFNNNGQAMSHFVSYGGGNALVLQQGGMAHPQVGAMPTAPQQSPPQYVQVTLPLGVEPGQAIRVQAPNGRVNEIVVPPGMGPGSTFTVEFAEESQPPEKYSSSKPTTTTTQYTPPGDVVATADAFPANDGVPPPAANANHDDGFASGFNNPNNNNNNNNFANSTFAANDGQYSSYPSATDARPVYNTPPAYRASTY
eukprot:scaffold9191_cov114-Cylindrotheca_fusiformis.AAC.12